MDVMRHPACPTVSYVCRTPSESVQGSTPMMMSLQRGSFCFQVLYAPSGSGEKASCPNADATIPAPGPDRRTDRARKQASADTDRRCLVCFIEVSDRFLTAIIPYWKRKVKSNPAFRAEKRNCSALTDRKVKNRFW